MLAFIIELIIIIGIIALIFYKLIRKSNDLDEKFYYIIWSILITAPIVIFLLDIHNIPTKLGLYENINIQNWLNFMSNYFNTGIGIIMSVFIMVYQMEKNNKENKNRDKENLRIENMPMLKYCIDTEKNEFAEQIITNIENGQEYGLNILIKNIGLNSIKNIKVDCKISLINVLTYRIFGKHSLEVLERGSNIVINRTFFLKRSKEPYDIDIIVYYEDVLSNWYRQILNIHYDTSDISKDKYVGVVKYEVNKEELIKEENIKSKVL